jgi:hypothetical protein
MAIPTGMTVKPYIAVLTTLAAQYRQQAECILKRGEFLWSAHGIVTQFLGPDLYCSAGFFDAMRPMRVQSVSGFIRLCSFIGIDYEFSI